MKTRICLLFVAILTWTAPFLNAQSFNTSKLDSLLDYLAGKNKAMGSLAIMENNNVIYSKAVGYATFEPQKIPSGTKTKYRIGSVSKMFTAVMIFQLIDEGKIELSTSLANYYPSVKNAEKITIGHLLSHRSGIHNFTSDSSYLTWMLEPKSKKELIEIISSSKTDFEPGTKTEYSNSNFVLLGFIIEDVNKKSYNQILQERICSKIGLTNTYYGKKTNVDENECYSYDFKSNWEKSSETDMSIPHGAGAIVSTSEDLTKFISSLFAGQLVSESSLKQMKTFTNGLGFGIQEFPYENKKIYGHGGSIDGFNSQLCYFPDQHVAIAYCSNGTVYSINDIILGAVSIYFNKNYSLPVFTTYEVKPEDLDQYTGNYSSQQLPIKIAIFKQDNKLMGQGAGQPAIPLDASAPNTFTFEKAGIKMIFYPEKQEFILEQTGSKFTFTKDK